MSNAQKLATNIDSKPLADESIISGSKHSHDGLVARGNAHDHSQGDGALIDHNFALTNAGKLISHGDIDLFLNQPVKTTSSPTFYNLTVSNIKATSSTGIFFAHNLPQGSTKVTTTGVVAGFVQNAGSSTTFVSSSSTFTGNYGTKAYTVGDIVRTLKKLGFMTT